MDAIPCPKCKSLATHIAKLRSPYINMAHDEVFSCRTCGTRVYGPDKVGELVSRHQAAVQAGREREEADALRLRLLEEEARRLELIKEEPPPPPKCAWPPCPNPVRVNSKYCGRTCSDRNAHSRAKERAALKTA